MSSTVTGMTPHCTSSRNTFPGPTLGSWSTSPTSTRRLPFRIWAKKMCDSLMSDMVNSSAMMKSASSMPSISSLPSSLVSPRALCMVMASCHPVLSAILRLALPVGAVSSTLPPPSFLWTWSSTFCTVVFPVPGPPVMMLTVWRNAFLTPSSCFGERLIPSSSCASARRAVMSFPS